MNVIFLQHPDTALMQEAAEEIVKRFRTQMDNIPKVSLYDSRKGVILTIPRETILSCPLKIL